MAKDAPGMKGIRSRNKDGRLRDKRDNTLIGTIEKEYAISINAKSSTKLGKYLKKHKIKSLNDLIHGR
jgi:hypothetical protein